MVFPLVLADKNIFVQVLVHNTREDTVVPHVI